MPPREQGQYFSHGSWPRMAVVSAGFEPAISRRSGEHLPSAPEAVLSGFHGFPPQYLDELTVFQNDRSGAETRR